MTEYCTTCLLFREAAAKYYRKAARLGSTGDSLADQAVADATYNLKELSSSANERAAEGMERLLHLASQPAGTMSYQASAAVSS